MFTSNTIKTDVITVTPNTARKLLEQNTGNRKVSQANLNKVKAAISRGDWALNGEAIKIAKTGRILDGQHRLHACIELDTPIETLIVYGLDDDTQDTMDTGKARTVADVLAISGYKNAVPLAAATIAIIRAEKWGIRAAVAAGSSSYTITAKQALERLTEEPSLAELPTIVSPVKKIGIPGKTAGLIYYICSGISQEDADDFFSKLASGEGLDRGNPILALRNQVINIKQETRGQVNQQIVAALMIKAWNKYRTGEETKLLRFSPGGANPEKFPEPI